MKQMVNAFSEYARSPSMDVTRLDVNALIAEVSELYHANPEKPLAIKLALDKNLPRIEADAGRLRQVLHNLLRNAVEATEHQPEAQVGISTRRVHGVDADLVEIKVVDNGPGFSSDIVHQAFDPYVTTDSSVSDYLGALVPVLQQWQAAVNASIGTPVLAAVPNFNAASDTTQTYLSALSPVLASWETSAETSRGHDFLPTPPTFAPDTFAPEFVCPSDTTFACADSAGSF